MADDMAARAFQLERSRQLAQYRRDATYVAGLAAQLAQAADGSAGGFSSEARRLASEALALAQRAAEVDALTGVAYLAEAGEAEAGEDDA